MKVTMITIDVYERQTLKDGTKAQPTHTATITGTPHAGYVIVTANGFNSTVYKTIQDARKALTDHPEEPEQNEEPEQIEEQSQTKIKLPNRLKYWILCWNMGLYASMKWRPTKQDETPAPPLTAEELEAVEELKANGTLYNGNDVEPW